jgi:alpha-N-arabinofuranosidase
LKGTSVTLDDEDSTTFLGRRQEHFKCRASTLLDFTPEAEGQEAGLVLRANEKFHYDLGVTRAGGGRKVSLRLRTQGVSRVAAEKEIPPGPVTLSVQAQVEGYEFLYAMEDGKFLTLGKAPSRDLSTEVAGGFTGVYFGLYACHAGEGPMPPADFDWFEYLPEEGGN